MYQRVLDRYDRGGRDRRTEGREFQSGWVDPLLVLVVGYIGVVVTVGLVGRKDWWYLVVVMIVVGKGNVVVG